MLKCRQWYKIKYQKSKVPPYKYGCANSSKIISVIERNTQYAGSSKNLITNSAHKTKVIDQHMSGNTYFKNNYQI